MPPRPLHPTKPVKTPSSAPVSSTAAPAAAPAARAFKVLQSSRAPAQMLLGLRRGG
jgi:hypothetical protein